MTNVKTNDKFNGLINEGDVCIIESRKINLCKKQSSQARKALEVSQSTQS